MIPYFLYKRRVVRLFQHLWKSAPRSYLDLKFWAGEASDITTQIEPEYLPDIVESIERDVLAWLHDDGGEETFSIFLEPFGLLLFNRAEIYFKSCSNCWDAWRIASCNLYPKLICYKVCELGSNEYFGDIRLPNEIRPQNYTSEPEEVNWNAILDPL